MTEMQDVPSAPGSVTQVRLCTSRLQEVAKSLNITVFVTGHVTKNGDLAGPRTLEHIVDTVLYMEGDPVTQTRIIRSVKNRFGSTPEIGVFDMKEEGLVEVPKRLSVLGIEEGLVLVLPNQCPQGQSHIESSSPVE